jgi:hypothetical protein
MRLFIWGVFWVICPGKQARRLLSVRRSEQLVVFRWGSAFSGNAKPKDPEQPVGYLQGEIGPDAGQEFIEGPLVNLSVFRQPIDAQAALACGLPDMVRQTGLFVFGLSHGGPVG